ncbi:MAG: hypothetical protein MJ132_06485 [Clostridia bacterium]|nr:hypothetical protein [Clostridia bacterium]
MLYPDKNSRKLNEELFCDPTVHYRGAPFWAWNCQMNRELIQEQISCFKQMGFGGFHIHSRTGMATPYLQEEFFDLVRFAVDEAERNGLRAWLYDEDRWPSGAAGGLVTVHPEFRERSLLMTLNDRSDDLPFDTAVQEGKPYYLCSYAVSLNQNGLLTDYRTVSRNAIPSAGERIYHAFVICAQNDPWYNNQTYSDNLNPQAVSAFIHTTHDAYKKAIGDRFGNSVPALFTDEPRPAFSRRFVQALGDESVQIAWTPDFPIGFQQTCGYDIVERIPEIFWDFDRPNGAKVRYDYHNYKATRFAHVFVHKCADWCNQNGLVFTGHMISEDRLPDQTAAAGDVMRCYPDFSLPGIDVLCNYILFNTAKQAQSVVHQFGKEGMMSELYGVTHWDFDFRGHKFQGDWLAALGVTQRVPHLTWASMAGEAKRDYPASIGAQSPWFSQYRYLEDHFARLNTALTRGKPVVSVGVIHPIESYWMYAGPNDASGRTGEALQQRFGQLTDWLLKDLIDFDFLNESILGNENICTENGLSVGEMTYRTVIVPDCTTLRSGPYKIFENFVSQGGKLIFLGRIPTHENALLSERGNRLAQQAVCMDFDREKLLFALTSERFCTLQTVDGRACRDYISQLRQDATGKWLFLAPAVETAPDDSLPKHLKLTLKGSVSATVYNTVDGEKHSLCGHLEKGAAGEISVFEISLYPQDSLLLFLEDGMPILAAQSLIEDEFVSVPVPETVHYSRCEPNVLLLDRFAAELDGQPIVTDLPFEEILRLDNVIRAKIGLPSRTNKFAQPWVTKESGVFHSVHLKTVFVAETAVKDCFLALENAENSRIVLNGVPVPSTVVGYYVDRAISTVALPNIRVGKNILEIDYPYGERGGLECMYILGDFNVTVCGTSAHIVPKAESLQFGSITGQGLPFYGGNIEYEIPFETDCTAKSLRITVPSYRGALVGVLLDDEPVGRIAFAPFSVSVENVKAGRHKVKLQLFGNRYNTFGSLHNVNPADTWYGFMHWRSVGDAWSYEYGVKETGILAVPKIEASFEKEGVADEKAGA